MEKEITTDAGILNLFDNEQEFILHSLHYPWVVRVNISSPSGVERVTNKIYIWVPVSAVSHSSVLPVLCITHLNRILLYATLFCQQTLYSFLVLNRD